MHTVAHREALVWEVRHMYLAFWSLATLTSRSVLLPFSWAVPGSRVDLLLLLSHHPPPVSVRRRSSDPDPQADLTLAILGCPGVPAHHRRMEWLPAGKTAAPNHSSGDIFQHATCNSIYSNSPCLKMSTNLSKDERLRRSSNIQCLQGNMRRSKASLLSLMVDI